MNVFTTKEMAERCGVGERWIRQLATEGRIYPCRKVHKNWLFAANATVIRPPERWNRQPQKLVLPHESLTVRDLLKHAQHWLD